MHRIILCCIIIAIKYNEDSYYANDYYAKVGGVSTEELRRLEYYFIQAIDFDLYVDNELLEKYKELLVSYGRGKMEKAKN